MISVEFRKKFFDLLCRNSSPDFIRYLRAYEGLSVPQQESLEVSCELVNGRRVDGMRMAISCLSRKDVLKWLSACRQKIPFIQDLLFENTTQDCFGIGLADYSSGAGVCRMKIYNTYGPSQTQVRKAAHIQKSFSLLNMGDLQFKKDLEMFGKIEGMAIDWDHQGQATIKVYFGFFGPEQLSVGSLRALSKEEI